jgi:flagellar motility protein MotE (MotC chaperone)
MCIAILGTSIALLITSAAIVYRTGRSRKVVATELEQRVHERTKELQKYVDSLQRSRAERNFFLDSISKRINASLATMKGLGKIASTYENMPPELVKNIDVTADTLADILQQIALEKKL